MSQYLIRVGAEKYLSHLPARDGLLIVTSAIEGYTRHDGKGMCNQALIFDSLEKAEGVIKAYQNTKLPKGKVHSNLKAVACRFADKVS